MRKISTQYSTSANKTNKAKRWTHKAYSDVKSKSFWSGVDEGFLRREYNEFNSNPGKDYKMFLKQVAYSLEKTEYQVRQKLKELYSQRHIKKRKH